MVRPRNKRFPLCITWTPLPGLTQLIPSIGHTGIGDSQGIIHDFAGPYYISIDDFAFGETYKYVILDLDGVSEEQFNKAILDADTVYKQRMHNIFCDNCHSHVARVLNILKYKGHDNYTMIDIWWMCITNSKYVSCSHIICTYFLYLFVGLVAIFVTLILPLFTAK